MKEYLKKLDLTNQIIQQKIVSIIFCIMSIIMTIVNTYTYHYYLAFATIGMGVVGLLSIYAVHKLEMYRFVSFMLYGTFFVLCTGYLIFGTADGFSSNWFYMLPILSYLLFALKVGLVVNIGSWLFLIVLLWTPIHSYIFHYQVTFLDRFPIMYLFVILITSLLEWIRLCVTKKLDQANKTLEHAATTDRLTKALTYYGLEKIYQKIDKSMHQYSLISMDIKNYKIVNDLFGVTYGNRLLVKMTTLLEQELVKGEYIARIDSDNFALLLRYDTLEQLEQRLVKWHDSIINMDSRYRVEVSYGIYVVNQDSIFERAYTASLFALETLEDATIYYRYFTEKQRTEALERQELGKEIEKAIENNEFGAYIQPKYSLKSKKYCGGEALVRWIKPDGTIISPYKFIPYVEANGLIQTIDAIILKQVCLFQKDCLQRGKQLFPISVNVSRANVLNPNFVDNFIKTVDSYHIPRSCIEVELTESLALSSEKDFYKMALQLHQLGFIICMDDFGTGFSSLSMLKDIHIDIVKFDKSLFDNGLSTKRDCTFIDELISLCHGLNQKIVAEGIEKQEMVTKLEELQCDVIQGYYFGKPMSQKEYIKLLYR